MQTVHSHVLRSMLFTSLLSLSALAGESSLLWRELDNFNRAELESGWLVITRGKGRVELRPASGPDGSWALVVAMSEAKGRRAVAILAGPPQIGGGPPLRVAFDMKITGGASGFKKGIRYGRADNYVELGRFAHANGDPVKRKIFLDSERTFLELPLDAWLHFEVELTAARQSLLVWPFDAEYAAQPERYRSRDPLARLVSSKTLAPSGNQLLVINHNPFREDTHGQDRGTVWLDNLSCAGGANGAALAPDAATAISIRKGRRRFTIDRARGCIAGGWYAGRNVMALSPDEYVLRGRTAAVLASELEDAVTEILHHDDGELRLACRNPRLPWLALRKTYSFQDGCLSKRVEFSAEETVDGFLYVRAGMGLVPAFRRDGYYATFRSWDLPSFLPVAEVMMDQPMGHRNAHVATQMVCLVRPDLNAAVAQFQHAIDGRYVWPFYSVHSERLIYSPTGWRFPSFVFHPVRGATRSCEVRVRLFEGDQLDLHRHLRAAAEQHLDLTDEPPSWVRQAKIDAICWGRDVVGFAHRLQGLIDCSRYSRDEFGLLNLWGWATWAHLPVAPDERVQSIDVNGKRVEVPTQVLVRRFARIHRELPNVKVGTYHFLLSMAPKHAYAQARRDWWAHGPDGNLLTQPEPGWTAARLAMSGNGVMATMLEQLKREQERYQTDFTYIDGGSKALVLSDWRTMQTDQPTHFQGWWRDIRKMRHSGARLGALFLNNSLSPFADIAYFENGGLRRDLDRDWRSVAEALLVTKLYAPQGAYRALLYRRGRGDPEPEYTNLVLSLGLRPTGSGSLHILPDWPRLFGYLPYINAAFELRDTVLVDAVIRPRFWRDTTRACLVQAQVLRQGNAALLTVANHEGDAQTANIVVDLAAAGLDSTRPIYIRHQQVEPADYREMAPVSGASKPLPLRRVVTARPWRVRRPDGGPHWREALTVLPKALIVLSASHSPAAITAIDGRPTQFELPNVLGATVDLRTAGDGRWSLNVDAPHPTVDVCLSLPDDWTGCRLDAESAASGVSVLTSHDGQSVRLRVPSGSRHIAIHSQMP